LFYFGVTLAKHHQLTVYIIISVKSHTQNRTIYREKMFKLLNAPLSKVKQILVPLSDWFNS